MVVRLLQISVLNARAVTCGVLSAVDRSIEEIDEGFAHRQAPPLTLQPPLCFKHVLLAPAVAALGSA